MRYKHFLFFSTLLCMGVSWSQTYVGVTGALHYGYRNLEGDQSIDWLIEERNQSESPGFGFDVGVSAFHDFKNKTRIISGIRYVRFSERRIDTYFYTDTDFSEKNTIEYAYEYISIPISWGYRFGNDRISVTPSIGLYNQFALRQRVSAKMVWNEAGDYKSKNSYYGNESPLSRYNLALNSAISLDVKLTEQYKIRIAPTGLLMISPLVAAPINQRNYSAGLEIGVLYGLKK